MMPLCDTLRLGTKKTVKFPFWKLTPADAHKSGKAHGIVVTAAFVVRNRANQDNLAFEALADMLDIVGVQHVAGAEFGVGESLQRDHVGDVFAEADVLGHVDGERIIGEVAGHDKTI